MSTAAQWLDEDNKAHEANTNISRTVPQKLNKQLQSDDKALEYYQNVPNYSKKEFQEMMKILPS